MKNVCVPIQMLGQSGCRFSFPDIVIYVDPYLSNSVEELDAPDLVRQVPIFIDPSNVVDADVVLITHEHMDHCDPQTLPLLARASPMAHFYGPPPVISRLLEWGIDPSRVTLITENWHETAVGVRFCAIPAAHPEISRDEHGNLNFVGYLIEFFDQKIYIAGDTFAGQEIIDALIDKGPINTAFLPVNEHNFFRGRRGITGNMSVREAFEFAEEIGVKQVVAVHWDMFSINSVDPEEIQCIYKILKPNFSLLINPTQLPLKKLDVSIVIRTLNEARYLEALLNSIAEQDAPSIEFEVILVDSGSIDETIEIAGRYGCRIGHIDRQDFSFGRSLNIGCEMAAGELIVIISGHCVPVDKYWLNRLCKPLIDGIADYAYGRQYGGKDSHFSECRIFSKYFPGDSKIHGDEYYCNNANSVLLRSTWKSYGFDESLTGLEDLELAKRLISDNKKIAYVSDAGVFHYHNESWAQVRRRFEREAIALQKIMPQIHISYMDTLRYFFSSIYSDWRISRRDGASAKLIDIVFYRWNQYIGSWSGNHMHRKLSSVQKEKYFFPK